ncbi:unnamed protein product [Closterium sp. NIES-64]|nr:unnamed protein product [Closterium sp. NIES-64]
MDASCAALLLGLVFVGCQPLCLRVLQPDVPCCAAPCRDVLGGAVQLFSSHFPIFPGPAVCPTTCGSCPAGATCTVAFGFIPYCICPAGYGLTSIGCISGALPTVSSTSITFYDQPNYTITPTTFTTRLDFNDCTTLPALVASRVRSYLRIDGVPGGMGECVALNQYNQEGCVGAYTSYNGMSTPTGMGAVGYV